MNRAEAKSALEQSLPRVFATMEREVRFSGLVASSRTFVTGDGSEVEIRFHRDHGPQFRMGDGPWEGRPA